MFTNAQLKKLILPLMVEQTLAVLVGMVDTVMVSSLGEAAVSGVSLMDMLSVVIINLFSAMATGGAVVCSQLLGAKKQHDACKASNQLMIVVLTISIALMSFVLALKRPLINLFFGDIEPDVMSNAITYLSITALSYPFIAVYNGGAALFRSMNRSRVTMYASIIANLINCAGNALGIYVFKLGVAGAAIPTLISRAVAAFILISLLTRPGQPIHLLHGQYKPDFPVIRRILYIGIPSGIENSLFQLGKVIIMSVVSAFGTVQIAANAVANTFAGFGILPAQAVNLAVITVIGHCVGAGDMEQVRFYTKKLHKWIYACLYMLNVPLLLGIRFIIRIYDLSPETLDLACKLIIIHNGTALLFWPLAFSLPNVLRACNDVRYTMTVSVCSMAFCRVLFSFVLGRWLGMGVVGVWWAMIMDWVVRLSFFMYRYMKGSWQKTAVKALQ